jgi:hypothetical protein
MDSADGGLQYMTDRFITGEEIESKAALEEALGSVLQAAIQGGIDPCGSWVYDTDELDLDLEVLVVALADEAD